MAKDRDNGNFPRGDIQDENSPARKNLFSKMPRVGGRFNIGDLLSGMDRDNTRQVYEDLCGNKKELEDRLTQSRKTEEELKKQLEAIEKEKENYVKEKDRISGGYEEILELIRGYISDISPLTEQGNDNYSREDIEKIRKFTGELEKLLAADERGIAFRFHGGEADAEEQERYFSGINNYGYDVPAAVDKNGRVIFDLYGYKNTENS